VYRRLAASLVVSGLVVASIVTESSGVDAQATTTTAPVVVRVGGGGKARIRVQLSEGRAMPCDSGENRPLLNGRLAPGETFRGEIAGDCVCVRHTTPAFPDTDWTESGLVCRPRICRGRICRPAPDPTIFLNFL